MQACTLGWVVAPDDGALARVIWSSYGTFVRPPFTQPFNYVFISGGLTDHNPVRLYSIAQTVPPMPTGSVLFGSCVPLTHCHYFMTL